MAKVQHTCTGCVPIDASIIDVYVTLVETNKSVTAAEASRSEAEAARVAAETLRTSTFATDHGRAVADHSIAQSDHATAGSDHEATVAATNAANAAAAVANAKAELVQARLDTADADHTRAEGDHSTAVSDHSTASSDHTTAQSDHSTAGADHTRAETDHSTAASDHTASGTATAAATAAAALATEKAALVQDKLDRADTDHTQAEADHTTASSDHTTAAADHSLAGTDHTTASADHTLAGTDHTTAASDHSTAASDHTTAAGDHTTAEADHALYEADHAVMEGYDTRLGTVETEVTGLSQEVGGESITVSSADSFPDKRRHQVSQSSASSTGNRYTIGLPITKGTTIKVSSSYSPGINVTGYDTFNNGCIGSTPGRLQIYQSGYSTSEITGVASVDQVLIIKWKKSDESAITDEQITDMLASLTVQVVFPAFGLVADIEKNKEDIADAQVNISHLEELCSPVFGNHTPGYPTSSGKWMVQTSHPYISHIPIRVKPGDEIKVLSVQSATFVGYLKTHSATPLTNLDNNTSIDYSSVAGYTDRIGTTAGVEYVGIVPNDANYIIVAFGHDTKPDLDVRYIVVNNKVVYLRDKEIYSANTTKDNLNVLSEVVGESKYTIDSTDDFPDKRRHPTGTYQSSSTGTRYTIGVHIEKGTKVKLSSSYSPGINVTGYDTFNNGCIGIETGRLQIYGGYSTDEITGVASVAQELIVKWKNSDDSAITDVQIELMLASLSVELIVPGNGIIGDVEVLQEQMEHIIDDEGSVLTVSNDTKLLYIGPLMQKSASGNTFTDSTTTVTQRCALSVPDYNAKVSIKIPEEYRVGFITGYTTSNVLLTWAADSGLLSNGDTYSFDGHNGQIYRVYFKRADGGVLTVSEIGELITRGAIQLTYRSVDGSIVERNSHTEHYVKGMMRKFTGTLANDDGLHKMPVLTHLSDIHGDATRFENFVQYSDFLEADAAIVSGDLVPMAGREDGTNYIDDIMDKYGVMVLPVIGNHDARNNTTKELQNAILAHSIEKYSLQTLAGETYPTFYYKDITEHSIRIIALNLYCAGQKTTNDWRFTQEQISWFVDTLAATPSGYGVVVVMHSPETITTKDDLFAKFYQSNGGTDVTFHNTYYPIRRIVDAFIGKTTLSGTFTETITGDVVETITINADFTGVATGVEFICYLTGHRHKDAIGYVKDADNMQLMCNISLGFALYGDSNYHSYAEVADVPRGGKGFTQDLFNVYVIDRAEGKVRVARIGSNMNQSFEMRDYMTIPYK